MPCRRPPSRERCVVTVPASRSVFVCGVVEVIDGFAWSARDLRWNWLHEAHRADRLQAQLDEQAREMESIRQRLAAQQALNEEVLGSTSWRITRPARRVGRALRGLRGS